MSFPKLMNQLFGVLEWSLFQSFKPINNCVLRRIHPLPKVEVTLTVFSGKFFAHSFDILFPSIYNIHHLASTAGLLLPFNICWEPNIFKSKYTKFSRGTLSHGQCVDFW